MEYLIGFSCLLLAIMWVLRMPLAPLHGWRAALSSLQPRRTT
jgi:hypothetical protein